VRVTAEDDLQFPWDAEAWAKHKAKEKDMGNRQEAERIAKTMWMIAKPFCTENDFNDMVQDSLPIQNMIDAITTALGAKDQEIEKLRSDLKTARMDKWHEKDYELAKKDQEIEKLRQTKFNDMMNKNTLSIISRAELENLVVHQNKNNLVYKADIEKMDSLLRRKEEQISSLQEKMLGHIDLLKQVVGALTLIWTEGVTAGQLKDRVHDVLSLPALAAYRNEPKT